MKANVGLFGWPNVGIFMLGLVAVMLICAVLTSTPIEASDHVAFVLLALLGVTMCAIGGAPNASESLLDPFALLGTGLGIALLLLVLAETFGVDLPFVETERDAFVLLASIGVIKVSVSSLHQISIYNRPAQHV